MIGGKRMPGPFNHGPNPKLWSFFSTVVHMHALHMMCYQKVEKHAMNFDLNDNTLS
jgi:hypothetical protein